MKDWTRQILTRRGPLYDRDSGKRDEYNRVIWKETWPTWWITDLFFKLGLDMDR